MFDSDRMSLMVSIDTGADSDTDHGEVRVDGWMAPPDLYRVEVHTAAGTLATATDDQGRFAFDRLARGRMQFRAVPLRWAGPQVAMITPAVDV